MTHDLFSGKYDAATRRGSRLFMSTLKYRGRDLNYAHFARVARFVPSVKLSTAVSADTVFRGATSRAACGSCPRRNAEGEI